MASVNRLRAVGSNRFKRNVCHERDRDLIISGICVTP